jgi:hypothetical protein
MIILSSLMVLVHLALNVPCPCCEKREREREDLVELECGLHFLFILSSLDGIAF